MENSSLNKAHQQQRKAEALLKQKKFDECIECHKKAIDYLEQAFDLTENPRSLESLRLQKEYHQKQVNAVHLKKFQVEDLGHMERERKISLSSLSSQNGEFSLEDNINRTIEVHDSLIGYLRKRNGSDNDSFSTSDNDDNVTTAVVGNKHPKNESVIIEELQVLSEQFKKFVQILLMQLDEKNKEIGLLKKQLEIERNKGQKNSLRVITDSSGGTSPFVFSPSSELSPDVHERALPPLPPLEFPNLDFINSTKSININPLNPNNN